MQEKISSSIIFSVIVAVVFVIAVVLIFQQTGELDRQLAAMVSFPEYQEKEEVGGGLPGKIVEQAKKMILSGCLKTADKTFETLWNQECEERGLQEKCDLPKWIAEDLMNKNQQLEEECYKKYPVE